MAGSEPGTAAVRCGICETAEFKIDGPLRHGKPENYWQHMHKDHPLACDWVRGFFPTYVFGRPSAEIGERIVLHLSDCAPCREALAEFINCNGRTNFTPPSASQEG